jgi:hypothetical protein
VRAVDLARTCRGPSRHAILAPNARIGRNRDIRATSAAIADLERVAVAGAKAGSIGGGSGASQLLEPRDTSRPSAYAADGTDSGRSNDPRCSRGKLVHRVDDRHL